MQPPLAPAPPHPGQHIPQSTENSNADLREQLLAAQVVGASNPLHQPHHHVHPHGPTASVMENMRRLSNSASPASHNVIDPAIAGPGPIGGPLPIPMPVVPGAVMPPVSASNPNINNQTDSGGEDTTLGDGEGSGRKASKRELSTSKRAAQNRAAQRAFRQRKEGYIKKMEAEVKDYKVLEDNYKAVQAENYQLRDYIINLQSRLIESQGEYPQPPSNIDLSQPRQDNHNSLPPPPPPPPPPPSASQGLTAPIATMVPSADQSSHLQASAVQAQAVAELAANGNNNNSATAANKHPHEDATVAAAAALQQQQQHQNLAAAAAAAAAATGNGYPSKRIKTHGEMELDMSNRTTSASDGSRAPMPAAMMMRSGGGMN
ncbi:MAG: hypothetical protein M1816_007307 [Peltula sp. TS41687]|nr:MAG: hypothetical protein M1816_007307 [Peltula sp. TS41687]